MKIIKRKKIVLPETMTDKFKQGFQELNNKLILEEEEKTEELLDKLRKSNIWVIVETFYIDNPIVNGRKDFWKTKSFEKGIKKVRKAIKGTLFNESEFLAYKDRKFTISEILESIETHKLALNPEYKPIDKKFLKVNLDQFLFNPYAKHIGKSFFLYWMNNKPIMNIPLVEDMYPEVTDAIILLFEFTNLDTREMNQITKGVSLFESLFEAVTLSPVYRNTPETHAKILHDIITDIFSFVDIEIQPRNFISPKMESWIVKGLKDSPYIV
jgi:hypothetical protein